MLFFYSRESVIELKDIAAIDNRVGILFQQCTDAIKFEGIFACDNTADDIRHNSPESIILNEKDVVANKVDVDALAQLFMNGDEIVACPSKTCPT